MAPAATQTPNHLEPSPLGTKEYWDSLYDREITNHTLDPSDEGTIWFDDSSAEDKAVAFLEEQIGELALLGDLGVGKENCSFLDLGTGNGHFLFRLREGEEVDSDEEEEEGSQAGTGSREKSSWNGRMLGVDYSQKSIDFAKKIAIDKGFGPSDGTAKQVEFVHWDLITESSSPILSPPNENGWDVVLDKGTFDAISLSEELDGQGRRICEGYKERVVPLIRKGGVLLITSCNWTEEELDTWFVGGELERVKSIEYRSFSFGGKKGQTISSVCFRRKA